MKSVLRGLATSSRARGLVLPRLGVTAMLIAATTSGCAYASSSSSSHEEELGSVSSAIVGGVVDEEDSAVVGLLASSDVPFCSGTLIGPRAVVTAAHCLADSTPRHVLVGNNVKVAIVDSFSHPDFDRTSLTHDVAVVILGEDAKGVTPITMGAAPKPGSRVKVVGFGHASADDRSGLRVRRSGFQQVDQLGDSDFRAHPDPSSPCSHDSGGAVLSEDGRELVGIISAGDAACTAYAFSSRADSHRAFIDDVVSPAPATSTGCSATSSSFHQTNTAALACAVFGLLMLGSARRRRTS